jgi:catechol 2,3-dioxygenase-like lactoylglutathione lyase family enzyme/protein tyrosine phosphatase (PTP) superfamily phosphohydrolase (DUF442 family)
VRRIAHADPEAIYHWRRLDDQITTSGQPTELQLKDLHALGIRHIVNLGLHSHEKALPNEAASVSRLGMTYIPIPVDFQNPTGQDFDQFCAVMKQLKDVPVHVHCIANYRVSAFFYRYRRDVLGIEEARARADMEPRGRLGGVCEPLTDEARPMTIEINGMAHVILTVSRFEVAREFYRKLLPEFGMKPVFDGDKLFYCVGARTAIGIEPCDPALAGERFVQQRVGLHHLCLRARSREDVDRCAALLKEIDATIVRGPQEGTWAPGYYYVLFEDPDGIRLEVNFVPGAGVLADGIQFNPTTGYI